MVILKPTNEALENAARVLREGGVVVIPTETVYGLACNALDPDAVRRVYEIKGRPSTSPLIVHLHSFDQVRTVAASWPKEAEALAKRFWPGPLTMVLPKKERVPEETTGGLDTVAVRVPNHPIALELIRRTGLPLAAPSANLFMGLSPTTADAVDEAILVDVTMVIDGGPCTIGLESTVLDLSEDHPRILRPGGITRADIQAALGRQLGEVPPLHLRKSPGNHPRHYAPRAKVVLVQKVADDSPGLTLAPAVNDLQIRMPLDARAYGAALYAGLRRLDVLGVEEIQVQIPPDSSDWEAVWDRLNRASHPEG